MQTQSEQFEYIFPGSIIGKLLGFTKDQFTGYLKMYKNIIYVTLIASLNPGSGNLTKLFNRMRELGFIIKVPLPLPAMEDILTHYNFTKTFEAIPEFMESELFEYVADNDTVPVWVSEIPKEELVDKY